MKFVVILWKNGMKIMKITKKKKEIVTNIYAYIPQPKSTQPNTYLGYISIFIYLVRVNCFLKNAKSLHFSVILG